MTDKTQPELSPLEAFQRNTAIMNQIVDSMKSDAVLETEKKEREKSSGDISALTKVEFPKEGGIHSWMDGHEHPYLGFPYLDFVNAIDGVKKLTKYFFQRLHYILRTATEEERKDIAKTVWFYEKLISALLYSVYRVVERHLIKPELYCKAVREVHRVLTEMMPLATIERGENRIQQFRDVLCMYLEFDNAYRFRFQDMMEELNKEEAEKDPAKELRRLYEINVSREVLEEMKDKQSQYKEFVSYLFSLPGKSQLASEFLKRLNLEEVKLSEIDKHWCGSRTDYRFGYKERELNNKKQ